MIKKTILQGLTIGAAFFVIWLGMSQIDFMKIFHVNQVAGKTEKKIGDLFWESIERTETIIRKDSVNDYVDKIVTRLAEKNGIDRDKIKLHIIDKDEVNAFAMPDDHLIVYTGLIKSCDNQEELAGVLGHEMAHIQKRHVMKKLVKEVGLSVILSMTTGGNSQTIQQALKMLSSSAYDRTLETEADMTSVDYMIKADINPEPMADLMYKMSTDASMPDAAYWISTHPESEERAKEILDYIKGKKFKKEKVLSDKEWKYLKDWVN
ncbi:MAG: M48 family metallopeptidase [Flavobacterium sp.]|nr:MAG: M48 family metallopeptidase [Flavobacterium sp.]